MKKLLTSFVLFYSIISSAQIKSTTEKPELLNSATRTFIDNANKTRINKDWSLMAEFKSGIGETVTFFPVQIVDLDSKKTINANTNVLRRY